VNAPGGWNFSNLHTADAPAAFAFYSAFLPWRWDEATAAGFVRVPGYGAHLAATSDPGIHERQRFSPPGFDDAIGGFVPLADGETAHWQVSFSVADRDASVAAVRAAGGTVESTDEDDWTRSAIVLDPAGGRFTLSQFAPKAW
jgi:uncharacterized protein